MVIVSRLAVRRWAANELLCHWITVLGSSISLETALVERRKTQKNRDGCDFLGFFAGYTIFWLVFPAQIALITTNPLWIIFLPITSHEGKEHGQNSRHQETPDQD
jgi:hypothetical protein